jgi:uncharacterized protein
MARRVNCPQCGTQTEYSPENRFRPFCSERCRLIDMGAWASDQYRIPAAPADTGDQPAEQPKDID